VIAYSILAADLLDSGRWISSGAGARVNFRSALPNRVAIDRHRVLLQAPSRAIGTASMAKWAVTYWPWTF